MEKTKKKLTSEYLASILKTVAQFTDATSAKPQIEKKIIQINI